jgi:general secretion pathway protein G
MNCRYEQADWSAMECVRITARRAFTFIEVMVVVLMVGILAAIVVPQFGGTTNDAKAGALQGALGGVRASIAGFRSKAILAGTAPFPSLAELTSVGTVTQGAIPANPFTNQASVQAVTAAQANARTVVNPTIAGWNYYVDNSASPPVAIFYANDATVTTVPDGAGGYKSANEL